MSSFHHLHRRYRSQLNKASPNRFTVSTLYNHHQPVPFGVSDPAANLSNDTSSQVDRLTTRLVSHLDQAILSCLHEREALQMLLTSTPRFDITETESSYLLEGELPGVAKNDINLDFVDDHTLVLKTTSKTFREHGSGPRDSAELSEQASTADTAAQTEHTKNTTSDKESSTLTTTNQSTDMTRREPIYHLTERTHDVFERAFKFPADVKIEAVKASLQSGVLTVTVPKVVPEPVAKEARQVRNITIEDASVEDDRDLVGTDADADASKAKL